MYAIFGWQYFYFFLGGGLKPEMGKYFYSFLSVGDSKVLGTEGKRWLGGGTLSFMKIIKMEYQQITTSLSVK